MQLKKSSLFVKTHFEIFLQIIFAKYRTFSFKWSFFTI